jgi:hypothetical protein
MPVPCRRIIAFAPLIALLATAGATAAVWPAHAAGSTLVVDVGTVVRPVTRVGSGGLYAFRDASIPPDSRLAALRLNQLTQPPPRVQQLPNGSPVPVGDALVVAPKAVRAGAQMIVRMPDIYRDFPYRWVSWSDWLGKVDTMIADRLANGTTNINGWELWNEPDWTWNTAAAGSFNDGWVRTYRHVRSRDAITPIVGPSYSRWDVNWMRSFLTRAKATGTLPTVICWHELSGWTLPTANINAYRALERELGIGPLPISINEYATPDEIDVPSVASHYVAQFERMGVRDAERAFWYESGTINGLLHNNAPTASYWMYKWYGDQAGNVVRVTPTQYNDGVAAYDSSRKIVNLVFAGEAGTNYVRVNGLGSFGSSVRATLNYTPGSGRFTNVSAPTQVSSATYSVSNGSITVPVTNQDHLGAYQLVVTPSAGPTTSYQQVYEAENATVHNAARLSTGTASNGGYVGRIDGTGDPRRDSFVDFIVNVPSARSYTMTIGYANGTGATATHGLAYNGSAWSTVSYPPTGGWGSFGATVSRTVNLNAGYNTIRLAKGSPYFAGGTGYAELDYLRLT